MQLDRDARSTLYSADIAPGSRRAGRMSMPTTRCRASQPNWPPTTAHEIRRYIVVGKGYRPLRGDDPKFTQPHAARIGRHRTVTELYVDQLIARIIVKDTVSG